ncbi:N-acetylmannosamine-6-phosphate 2-epimerase [Aquisalibacillus elongatus]|uniref:Putative N-acetylmannosamine-6-phosphate 2-epimerase n=1 Tax=Aquisalibacillus elongatus TaxID=485577 RepID=A0A3N5BA57_9BACI|nr:N-acetylmannosamine-6-phosphate 2-epimerase [Aquisalibacillus elongatus]RPF54267.1 N-acylglucosamine-6-phosphate 2-epimerase [Aquisalibacillus elongatus]
MEQILRKLEKGLIVSCQALPHEPLYGSDIMAKMAIAAEEGGAVGIRANTPWDIKEIKKHVSLPVIGLYKKRYADSDIYITPTIDDVREIVKAGADIVAFDATYRKRPDDQPLDAFVRQIRQEYPGLPLMADISTFEEAVVADELEVDVISTTLAGYTEDTKHLRGFDEVLLSEILRACQKPVIAEGRVHSPDIAKKCLEQGAYAVVVGAAITRPQEITKRFVSEMMAVSYKET